MYGDIYRDKKVLVTGHAGFCGSWLCLWLKRLGAEVVGYGHPPRTAPNHYELLGDPKYWPSSELLNFRFLAEVVSVTQPDLIIHLAAKAIVARTFTEPRETFENNVMGAVNILEAARQCPSVKGVVMVTTDKVYLDQNWIWAYREEGDELSGVDPYSASKVCVEQVIKCYRESYNMNISTARAGNVIGGGDWAEKRLIPDIVRAAAKGEKVIIHTPSATRPFQHVLEALQGYLLLGQRILTGQYENGYWKPLHPVNAAYNFGPTGEMTVLEVLQTAKEVWPAIDWEVDDTPTHPHMVYLLKIDSTKAIKELGWRPVWNMEEAVARSIGWYREFYQNGEVGSGWDLNQYEECLNHKSLWE